MHKQIWFPRTITYFARWPFRTISGSDIQG